MLMQVTRPISLALVLALAGNGVAAADGCQRIDFAEGGTVLLTNDSVEAINAVMEAPRLRVFSVSLRLPTDTAFVDTASLILEPQRDAVPRSQMCAARLTDRPCLSIELSGGMAVTVTLKGRGSVSGVLTRKVRDYVLETAMKCPQKSSGAMQP